MSFSNMMSYRFDDSLIKLMIKLIQDYDIFNSGGYATYCIDCYKNKGRLSVMRIGRTKVE